MMFKKNTFLVVVIRRFSDEMRKLKLTVIRKNNLTRRKGLRTVYKFDSNFLNNSLRLIMKIREFQNS